MTINQSYYSCIRFLLRIGSAATCSTLLYKLEIPTVIQTKSVRWDMHDHNDAHTPNVWSSTHLFFDIS
jgi:hypothetical protein